MLDANVIHNARLGKEWEGWSDLKKLQGNVEISGVAWICMKLRHPEETELNQGHTNQNQTQGLKKDKTYN